MKASSIEMGCRERGSYGQLHRLLLRNVAYDSSVSCVPLMTVIFSTLLLEFLMSFLLSSKTQSPEVLSKNNPRHSSS